MSSPEQTIETVTSGTSAPVAQTPLTPVVSAPDPTALVNQYFAANPTATPAQVAAAVQSIGGLTPGLSSALASHYGTTAGNIATNYSTLTKPTPAVVAAAAPVKTVATDPASTPLNTAKTAPSISDLLSQYDTQTQKGIKNAGLDTIMSTVNSGGNITDIASTGLVPQAVASYKDASGNTVTAAPNTYSVSKADGSGGSLNYFFTVDPKTGTTTPISNAGQNLTYTGGSGGGVLGGLASGITKALSNPLVDMAINFALPGAGAYISAAAAANNLAHGNTLAGLTDAALAAYGFNQSGGNVSVNPTISNALSSTTPTSPYSLTTPSVTSGSIDPMSPFYDPNAVSVPTGPLTPTDYTLNPGTSSGTGLNIQPGSGTNLFSGPTYNPTTGLLNGEGLQYSGTPNIDTMGGGQGLTTATPYGPLSQSGVSVYGSGNLPINPLTGQPLGSQLATTTTGLETAQLPVISTGLPLNPLTGKPLGSTLSTVNTGITAYTPAVQTAIDTLTNTALPSTKTGTGTTNTTSNTTNTTNNAASMSGLTPSVTSSTPDVIVGNTPYSVPLIPVSHKDGGSIGHYEEGGGLPPVSLTPRLHQGNSAPVQGYLNQSTISHPHTGLTRFEYRAEGGEVGEHTPEFFSEGGLNSLSNKYVTGRGDGTSDSIPAMLANGEFVIPADVVSNLGNGDNSSGAKVLDKFMQVIRHHKRDVAPDQLPPDSKGPLSYLAEAQKKVK